MYLYRLTNVEMTWLKKIWNMRMYFFFSLYVAICFPLIPLPVKQKIYLFVPSSSYVKKSATTTFSVTKIKKSYQLCCLAQLYFSFVLFLILNAGCSSYINNTLTNCNILLNHKNLVKVSISSLSGYLPSYVKNP